MKKSTRAAIAFFWLVILFAGRPACSSPASCIRDLAVRLTSLPFWRAPRGPIKIALCQTSTTVADFDYNVRVIERFLAKAAEHGAQVAVFPEMVVSSYPPRDWLERDDFLAANADAVTYIQNLARRIPHAPPTIIFGSVMPNPGDEGRALQNAVLVLQNGEIDHEQGKRLLAEGDVFDEMRYFEPAAASRLWRGPLGRAGLLVCEDAWQRVQVRNRWIHRRDIAQDVRGSDIIFHLNASPYEVDKHPNRVEIYSGFAQRARAPLVSVNQVGLQDDVLFDGRSTVISPGGEVLFELPAFEESIGFVELDLRGKKTAVLSHETFNWSWDAYGWKTAVAAAPPTESEIIRRALVLATREYFWKSGYENAVLGLSGGIDSSVVAGLLVEALGADHVIAAWMGQDGVSSPLGRTLATQVAANMGIRRFYGEINITDASRAVLPGILDFPFRDLKERFGQKVTDDNTTADNIPATLRYLVLRAFANEFDGLVVGTSNKTERAVGQTTTDADGSGAFSVIGDLWKTQVYELGRTLNAGGRNGIPEEVFTKPASAELPSGVTDEEKFGEFSGLDPLLKRYVEDNRSEEQLVSAGYPRDYVHRIIGIVRASEFKRHKSPTIPKVSRKAFGSGRRYPITSYFRPARAEKVPSYFSAEK